MSSAHYSISWNSYKNNFTKGFARLQQDAEFVDMTLAAEGHIVKVHQNIVALASPYLKTVLRSTHCQHPVIFLCNISHVVLAYLVEYMYTGEVTIPAHLVKTFAEACNVLQLSGGDGFVYPKSDVPAELNEVSTEISANQSSKNYAAHITIDPKDYHVQVNAVPVRIENNMRHNIDSSPTAEDDIHNEMDYEIPNCPAAIDNNDIPETISNIVDNITENLSEHVTNNSLEKSETTINVLYELKSGSQKPSSDSDINPSFIASNRISGSLRSDTQSFHINASNQSNHDRLEGDPDEGQKEKLEKRGHKLKSGMIIPCSTNTQYKDHVPQYSISNRGCLQLVFNQFIYSCHHHAKEGRKRRWRCIDYRRIHCPAFIDTIDDNIVDKAEVHNHPNHISKIQKKSKSKMLYPSFHIANESNQEKEHSTPNSAIDFSLFDLS